MDVYLDLNQLTMPPRCLGSRGGVGHRGGTSWGIWFDGPGSAPEDVGMAFGVGLGTVLDAFFWMASLI